MSNKTPETLAQNLINKFSQRGLTDDHIVIHHGSMVEVNVAPVCRSDQNFTRGVFSTAREHGWHVASMADDGDRIFMGR